MKKMVSLVCGLCICLALVLFLIFHGCMNLAVVFSEEAYNTICHLLGANWYALIGTLCLVFLVVLHFCYAIYLTIQNRAARGDDRCWSAENITYCAIESSYAETAKHLLNQWMNSSGHRKNFLNPRYTHIGCGTACYLDKGFVYVKATQNFMEKK